MLTGVILLAVFTAVVLAVWALYTAAVQAPLRQQQKVIGYRLESLVRAQERGSTDGSVELFKREILSSLPALQRLLLRFPRLETVQTALRQADWRISISSFLVLCALGAAVTFALVLRFTASPVLSVMLALMGASAPYLVLTYRRKKRLEKFLEQFPDAIDLIARAVRAGHAIATGFSMVADEMDAPLAEEFRQTHDEQKFGLPVQQALLNLQERVPLLDVRILTTAISIQREVGGNLAEVLDKIGHTIRERFKIRRQIRVYTAQGRLTGYILAALPVILGAILFSINPEYFRILFEHELGVLMIGSAILLQILGFLWIRKIINIKI